MGICDTLLLAPQFSGCLQSLDNRDIQRAGLHVLSCLLVSFSTMACNACQAIFKSQVQLQGIYQASTVTTVREALRMP